MNGVSRAEAIEIDVAVDAVDAAALAELPYHVRCAVGKHWVVVGVSSYKKRVVGEASRKISVVEVDVCIDDGSAAVVVENFHRQRMKAIHQLLIVPFAFSFHINHRHKRLLLAADVLFDVFELVVDSR